MYVDQHKKRQGYKMHVLNISIIAVFFFLFNFNQAKMAEDQELL